jgi:hypothetical protein
MNTKIKYPTYHPRVYMKQHSPDRRSTLDTSLLRVICDVIVRAIPGGLRCVGNKRAGYTVGGTF